MTPSGPQSKVAWVTGAGGLIGHDLIQIARPLSGWRVIGLTRADLDLTDYRAVRQRFEHDSPQLMIHCAALSRSGACEAHPQLAHQLNVEVTTQLLELFRNGRFLFLSSDMVFDGNSGNYDESAPVNPLSVYGETKALAERAVLQHPNGIVIRTSLNGGTSPTGDRGFNEMLRHDWARRVVTTFFTDEFRCPIASTETARALWQVAERGAPGIYHIAGAERLSRWDLGQLLARRWPRLRPQIRAGSLQEYKGPKRPADASLNCSKAQQILSAPLPCFSAWLESQPDLIF